MTKRGLSQLTSRGWVRLPEPGFTLFCAGMFPAHVQTTGNKYYVLVVGVLVSSFFLGLLMFTSGQETQDGIN